MKNVRLCENSIMKTTNWLNNFFTTIQVHFLIIGTIKKKIILSTEITFCIFFKIRPLN